MQINTYQNLYISNEIKCSLKGCQSVYNHRKRKFSICQSISQSVNQNHINLTLQNNFGCRIPEKGQNTWSNHKKPFMKSFIAWEGGEMDWVWFCVRKFPIIWSKVQAEMQIAWKMSKQQHFFLCVVSSCLCNRTAILCLENKSWFCKATARAEANGGSGGGVTPLPQETIFWKMLLSCQNFCDPSE